MSNKKLPSAIIFDWDNTLVDTWPLIHSAIDDTMKSMGKEPWGLEKVKEKVHASMRESFPALFGEKWQEAGKIYKESYRKNHLEQICFLPGALDLIQYLNENGVILFVISNKIGATLRKEVEHLGVANMFFAVIGSMDAKYDKPSKEPVDLALMGSELDPSQDIIWFIGDTIVDIECAYNSDCRPILFGENNNVGKNVIEKCSQNPEKSLLHFQNHEEIRRYFEVLTSP